MTIRVVQWTTGNVAKNAVRATLAHPQLELVGCYAWSPEKAGRDVGELCGLDPLGITAPNDLDELLALKPDVVLYLPMGWSVEVSVRLPDPCLHLIPTTTPTTIPST